MKHTEKEIREAFKKSKSKADVCRHFKMPTGGSGMKTANLWIEKYDIDISHFDGGASKKVKYKKITKTCPVCNSKFYVLKGQPKEKTTCSHACSNTYFRSGENNGNYVHGGSVYGFKLEYRHICFSYYEHKCALCNWSKIVDVHHIDGDHSNNKIENLIPLCPNHHRIAHMNEHKDEIQKEIEEFKRKNPGAKHNI